MKTTKRLVILLVFCAAPAWAQDYARTGPYIGVSGVYAIETFEDLSASNSGGIALRGGYRFLEHLAAEATFEWADDFEVGAAHLRAWGLSFGLKAYPFSGRVQPFALLAIGMARGEAWAFWDTAEETSFLVRIGGGLDLYATESWALSLELAYMIPTGDLDGFDYVSLGAGVTYRF